MLCLGFILASLSKSSHIPYLLSRDNCLTQTAGCRMSYPSSSIFASLLTIPRKKCVCKSLVFYALRTLPRSVSCKSCICHSYENCRVYTNNSHSETHYRPLTTHCPLPTSPSNWVNLR